MEAVGKIKEKYNIRCVVVGTGRHENDIKELAEKSGVSGITDFLGLRRNVADLLSAMDVFVLPSFQEGFSNALIEAMAMECPVIASDIPGNDEAFINGKQGIFVQPGNSSALADAIEQLYKDKESRLKISVEARKSIEEQFSIKKHVEKMENLYLNLLKKKGLV